MIYSNTCVGDCLYPLGTQHGNMCQPLEPREQGELSHSAGPHGSLCKTHVHDRGKMERGLGVNEVEWIVEVETRKDEIPGSRGRNMHGDILTSSRL